MRNYRTIQEWENEKDNLQRLLDQGVKHRDIGNLYKVSGSTIDFVVSKLGLIRHFEKFKIQDSVIDKNVDNKENLNITTLPAPIEYSLPIMLKIQILRYRSDRQKYSTSWAYYIPELGIWVKSTSEFNRRLKSLNKTYDEWECKWILRLPLDELYNHSLLWASKAVNFRFQDKPTETKNYIISEFMKGNFLSQEDIFLVKQDLINLYENSRLDSLYKVDYDFSLVPYVIKSPREKFTLLVSEVGSIKSFTGKYITDYFSLVIEKKDVKALIGNKLNAIRSMGKLEFINKAKIIHGDKRYNFSKVNYINNRTPVIIIDTRYNSEFEITPDHFLQGGGNPIDSESTGEQFIRTFLIEKLNIFPQSQVRMKGIKGRTTDTVIIDFIINYNNKTFWIEYNGIQHYEYIKYFYNEDINLFKNQIMRDENIKTHCKHNNIILIEIPYILNSYKKISEFLNKVLVLGIDPNTLIDYKSLYKI